MNKKPFNLSSSSVSSPLTAEAFHAVVEPLGIGRDRLAVAVSGGPDSMALACCVKRWADSNGKKVFAFIVDHLLRPESSQEAAMVRERLEALGIETEVLVWRHEPVTTRLHVQARKARYDLLLDACRRHDVQDLFLAHQREDQAETILMRFAKGSGLDGLAGMAAERLVSGIRLLRPFLSVSKQRLIATCREEGVAFVTDSSNSSARYARGRLRQILPLLEKEGLTVERLVDLGDRAREASEAIEHAARALLRCAAREDAAGIMALDLEQLRAAPRAVAMKALAACLSRIHAGDYPVERRKLLPLLDALCRDEAMNARTLQGCLVSKDKKDAIILREYRAIQDETPVLPGQTIDWDGRWQVGLSPQCTERGLAVRALGFQPHDKIDELAPQLRRLVTRGRARAVLPALWRGEELVMVPDFTGTAGHAAWARLRDGGAENA